MRLTLGCHSAIQLTPLSSPLTSDSGATVIKAIGVLLDNGAKEENLVLLSLFASPRGAKRVLSTYSKVCCTPVSAQKRVRPATPARR
jgi:hypothetical protein